MIWSKRCKFQPSNQMPIWPFLIPQTALEGNVGCHYMVNKRRGAVMMGVFSGEHILTIQDYRVHRSRAFRCLKLPYKIHGQPPLHTAMAVILRVSIRATLSAKTASFARAMIMLLTCNGSINDVWINSGIDWNWALEKWVAGHGLLSITLTKDKPIYVQTAYQSTSSSVNPRRIGIVPGHITCRITFKRFIENRQPETHYIPSIASYYHPKKPNLIVLTT